MQYSENDELLTLYGIHDDIREAGNNKLTGASLASAFSDGGIVSAARGI